MSEFVLWTTEVEPGFCGLTNLQNVADEWELQLGMPRADGFPAEAFFAMDPNHPKDLVLPECVSNLLDLVVVSPRVKEIIERRQPADTEFLRVKILNHKQRLAADDYWIVNPTRLQDCIDLENSEVVWNEIDPSCIANCYSLAIYEDRIEPGTLLFRAKHFPYPVFVQRSLAVELESSGASGIAFLEIEDYPE